MNKKLLISAAVATSFVVSSCVTTPNSRGLAGIFGSRTPSSIFAERGSKEFTDSDVAKLSSVANVSLSDARVITDNDESFQSKLDMIERARRSINMVYFIYAEDDSSAVLSNALIKKAASGVKVQLLVDFITNYTKFDHFRMMEEEGNGNLKVYYYNFPGENILEDAKYMTLPCPVKDPNTAPNACVNFKRPLMAQLADKETTAFSRMLLGGMYGKSGLALKVAFGYGAQINPEDYKSAKETSDEDKEHLIEFFKLLKDAMGGDLGAKIKLSLAMSTYGATLNPIMNEITGRFPISDPADQQKAVKKSAAWDHLTDYTHHKLLSVDGNEFQLGGRNIEDSYHMQNRISIKGRADKGKYIFMDTDFWGRARNAGALQDIDDTFNKLIRFDEMVADSRRVERIMPNEFMENAARLEANKPSASESAVGYCLPQSQKAAASGQLFDLGECIERSLPGMPGYQSKDARLKLAQKEMLKLAKIYNDPNNYTQKPYRNFRNQPWAAGVDHLSASDLAKAKFSYIENINYSKGNDKARSIGSKIGYEADYNKNLHAMWYRGLESICQASQKSNEEVRVIFHTAYLFMPSGLVVRLAKMLNGDYGDCRNVRITFLTNSIHTTDLNPINVAARYQMRELMRRADSAKANAANFEATNGRRYEAPPTIDYYEYRKTTAGSGLSLHTKVTLIGQDMILGSANADVRSYYMDTNNGVFIRGATDLNEKYTAYIDSLINDRSKTVSGMLSLDGRGSTNFQDLSDRDLEVQNQMILADMLNKFDKKGRVKIVGGESREVLKRKQKRQEAVLEAIRDHGKRISSDTYSLLNFRMEMSAGAGGSEASRIIEKLNEIANEFDADYKLL